MIEIHELTKRYGPTTAVSDLTFTVLGMVNFADSTDLAGYSGALRDLALADPSVSFASRPQRTTSRKGGGGMKGTPSAFSAKSSGT